MKPTVSSSSAGAFALAAGLTAAVIYCLKDQQQQAAESAKTKRVREELTLEEERDRRFALATSSSRTNRRARYLQQQSRDGVERSETRRNLTAPVLQLSLMLSTAFVAAFALWSGLLMLRPSISRLGPRQRHVTRMVLDVI